MVSRSTSGKKTSVGYTLGSRVSGSSLPLCPKGVLFVGVGEFLRRIHIGSSTKMPYLCVCTDLSKQKVSSSSKMLSWQLIVLLSTNMSALVLPTALNMLHNGDTCCLTSQRVYIGSFLFNVQDLPPLWLPYSCVV
jgi:hypothetical protein